MIRLGILVFFSVMCGLCHAFSPQTTAMVRTATFGSARRSVVVLDAKKKKRRRRKDKPGSAKSPAASAPPKKQVVAEVVQAKEVSPPPPTQPAKEPENVVTSQAETPPPVQEENVVTSQVETTPPVQEEEVKEPVMAETAKPSPKKGEAMPKDLQDVVNFKFDPDAKKSFGAEDVMAFEDGADNEEVLDDAVELPDMKELSKTKELEMALKKLQEEKQAQKPRIKRSDTKAFVKLLETNPYIDADDSFFEEEEYGTVEALLGERAKPFLGIPTGPLQVGHLVGALAIALMGFVDYPGFPLTNLPTPLRNCFQGGLATVYAINTVLAVLAVFKAMERGQSPILWATKTFTVGGLAFDQLTQLPTLEQQEKVKNQKGARALKNRKR